ncbi:carboxypeptidase-like regulatory domain-containing protein [Alkaliflexus imshenetskii]|uniref:carboxypeptidase-like regulatory domain-containing protein n=1 Tax=Alkaliflexus imshenetskii TaxID=286730 RepID=UPI00047A68FA|nr:carboxypeptidase-like regulatory domain-containing protein [Alkaliflexus imshenetskii]
MKTANQSLRRLLSGWMMIFLAVFLLTGNVFANEGEDDNFTQYKGIVTDSRSNDALVFATISVEGANVATVCNSDGEFLIKVPNSMLDRNMVISYIGYARKVIPIRELKPDGNRIQLDMTSVNLVEVSVFPSDPNLLMRAVLNRREKNYMNTPVEKTAFYRETIKKGWTYVSLTEAVVDIYKHPYTSPREDNVRLAIGRKSTDYGRLDTLVFKLQGGPVSALMLDIMKDPYLLFDEEMLNYYNFEMSNITRVDDRFIYVVNFSQKPEVKEPLYYGKLYIDTESLAITSAAFNMNLNDREEAARLFIRRKPAGARVYPTEASYLVNYREQDGRWYFGYSRGQVAFRVNWRRRLFNTNYYTTMEIAVTDWEATDERPYRASDRLKMNVIMEDAVTGFANDDFWGDYNVIEPEQSIESAIRRIQRRIDK